LSQKIVGNFARRKQWEVLKELSGVCERRGCVGCCTVTRLDILSKSWSLGLSTVNLDRYQWSTMVPTCMVLR